MASNIEHTVIVGGGLAAVRTAQALRDQAYAGKISILSDEMELPYDRPPLSKNYLLGKSSDEKIRLLSAEAFAELKVDLLLGHKAVGLDRVAKKVSVKGGGAVSYDRLVIATGASPILPTIFQGKKNIHVLRSADDARLLNGALKPKSRVGIVGAGFIGLEIASAAKSLDCEVTVIEAAEAPLIRSVGGELGKAIQQWHETKGVNFCCGSPVSQVHGTDGQISLELASGQMLSVDIVIVGVGQKTNIDWLIDTGLELHHGLVCDVYGRTNDPLVLGVGDATCCHVDNVCTPTFHWTATTDQATRVAKVICGKIDETPVIDDHYFWSDQHGSRLQFVGKVSANPRIVYVAGSPAEEKFVALCCNDEEVTAVLGLADPREFLRYGMPLRRGERAFLPT
ncbi:MAG: FAD-dependent oxidoreductase [Rhodocyclaceae bacterium]|nr:FAD-dependent oxidoreductase [Rhodocyclaceae bacterium]